MSSQHENSVILRFEKVLEFFLDGIPKPIFCVDSELEYGATFDFSSFGASLDYTGNSEYIYFPEFRECQSFNSICLWKCDSNSPSARIGSHYSPYVGTFKFDGKKLISQIILSNYKRRTIRVPNETCEETNLTILKSDRELRTSLLIDLYTQITEEYLTHEKDSLKRIIILATRNFSENYRNIIEMVISEIKKVYVRACGYAVYRYLNKNLLFRRILSPLCLNEIDDDDIDNKENKISQRYLMNDPVRFERVLNFKSSIYSIRDTLLWSEKTHNFFKDLQELWIKKFDRLVIFDIITSRWKTDADIFLTQLGCSMRAAFSRIRIEFYSQLEQILFNNLKKSNIIIPSNLQTIDDTDLERIFLATRIFLVNRVRSLILDALKDLVCFFTLKGNSILPHAKASKSPILEVYLIVGESGIPCSPSFAQLRFGISDLLDELLDSANNLPTPESVIMRTIDFKRHSLNSFDKSDFLIKSLLLNYIDSAGSIIEELRIKYTSFSTLPVIKGAYFTRTNEEIIKKQVNSLREGIEKISKISPDIVFCGCIAINSIEVKKWYTEQWKRYLNNYLNEIQNDILLFLKSSVEKCRYHNERLKKDPKTVEELEELNNTIKITEALSKKVEEEDCKKVIEWFKCLEALRIPVEAQVYAEAIELMRCPNSLMELINEAEKMRINNKPYIIEKLSEFRNVTRNQVTMIRDGVDELLSLFNVDVCDIAAQTCEELRGIVDKVIKSIDYISYCEKSLQIEQEEKFENFFLILRTFEVLEQFWGAAFNSTAVRDYYNNPVNNIDAIKMIENVQQWRRLLHSSTRNLRAYPGLVRLGRQQEQVLSDFESLEGVLICITTPGLRKNHWKEIARIVEPQLKNIQIDSSIKLRSLLEAGLHEHFEELKRVVDPALIDFETEASLERMKSEAKRTRFVFEHVEGIKDAFILSNLCRDSIFSQLESFLFNLKKLRQHISLSQFVINSIIEWEIAAERMRGTLLTWKEIEQEWVEVLRFGLTLESINEDALYSTSSREWKFLHEKIGSVNDIFSILSTTLRKPQYTLFTAMVQENIQEQLTLASTILGDVKKVVTSLLSGKREIFPRFYFLSDVEMISFLSVLNITTLTKLLSKMYSRVSDIGVEEGKVKEFITSDGAILKAENPIPLSAIPVENWMQNFDKTLQSSFFHELRTSVENHYHMDSMTWLRDSCVQIIDVALRIIHNRDLHESLSLAGNIGINAYSRRLKDITEEYIRLASESMEIGVRHVISSAINFLLFTRREVQLAIKLGVQTSEDLNKTAMLQTVMDNDGIYVQTIGFRLPYGMEFLGNYNVPLLTPEYVEKGLFSVFVSFAASSFPLFIGEPEKTSTLEYSAQYLGRFWWCLQCHSSLTLEGIARGIRGALSVGAIFCLRDINLIKKDLILPITELLRNVENACLSSKDLDEGNYSKIHLEINGDSITAVKNPCFQGALIIQKSDEIPSSLTLAFRPIYLPSIDFNVLAQGTLQALGCLQCMSLGQKISAMYTQFNEVLPGIFTIKSFLYMIKDACNYNSGTMVENLCTSFLRLFWEVIRNNEGLQKMLEWNVIYTLGVSKKFWEDALLEVNSIPGFEGILDRFTKLMKFHTEAVLVGPAFSGKTRIWKRWIQNSPYTVVSLRLMSSAEIYGDINNPGLLGSLAKRWNPLEQHTIIIESANFLQASMVFEIPMFVRVRPCKGSDFIKGPMTRVIIVSSKLDTANPRLMVDFAVFALPEPTSWKGFLKEHLQMIPNYNANVAFYAMTTLIDSFLDTRVSVDRSAVSYENRFAVAYRCSLFYKRWYAYAQSCCKYREEWVSDQAFALQCAVFSTFWTIGLRLNENDRFILRTVVEKVQSKLNKIAKEIGFTEDVLPPLENDILHYIATPLGWKKLGDASLEVGFNSAWFEKKSSLDVRQRVYSQFFQFNSRQITLTTLEYLINAGQSVLLIGGADQGKSTILNNMKNNKWWIHHMAYNNKGCNVVKIQEALLENLSMRQSKIYGPAVGRKLILCVDDVNIPGEHEFSQVMHLFSFIDRHSAICPPSLGYIPVTDLVCVGSSNLSSVYEKEVESTLVRLRLPDLEESEITKGVHDLFDMICASRRGIDISKEVTNFLITAQYTALNLMSGTLAGGWRKKEIKVNNFKEENKEEIPDEGYNHNSFGFNNEEGGLRLSYMHLFLKISDRALRLLSSSWDDKESVKNIFDSVYSLYVTMIYDTERRQQLHLKLKEAAEITLINTFSPDPVLLHMNCDEAPVEGQEETELPPCNKSQPHDWLRTYEAALISNTIEENINIDQTTNFMIITPPPLQKKKLVSVQTGAISLQSLQTKYALRWITLLLSSIHQCLRQSQTHVALIGPYDSGIRQALQIWGISIRINIAFLCDNYYGIDGYEKFIKEFMEILRYTCRNDSKMVVFVPYNVIKNSNIMGYLDAIVRGSDVTQYISFEEQFFLLNGRRDIRRTTKRLTISEHTELKQRICRRLSLIIHITSYEEMIRLGNEIPLIPFMLPIPLRTSELVNELVENLLHNEEENFRLIHENATSSNNENKNVVINTISSLELAGRPFSQLLTEIFHFIKEKITINIEQLLEFTFQAQRLYFFLTRLRHNSKESRSITDLPNAITIKSKEYEENLKKAISSKITSEQQKQTLLARARKQEERALRFQNSLDRLSQEANNTESLIMQEEEAMQTKTGRIAVLLNSAAARLSTIKISQIKQFKTLPPPQKGTLFVKAVYKIIGEEFQTTNPKEIWENGKTIMTSPKFISRLMAVTPSSLTYESLSQIHNSLREVRYGEISPFAGAIAEYVLAVMEATRVGEEVREALLHLNEKRLNYSSCRSKMDATKQRVHEASWKATNAYTDARRLAKRCDNLYNMIEDLKRRQAALVVLNDLVDRFNPFHSPEEAATREAQAEKGEGSIIMIAAQNAFFAILPEEQQHECFNQLQSLLGSWDIKAPVSLNDPIISYLLNRGIDNSDTILMESFSTEQKLCISALMQKVYFHWPFFGGVTPAFEKVMKHCLKFMCGDCIEVSIIDEKFEENVLEAAKNGSGLLVCDASVSSVLEKLTSLFLLRSRLRKSLIQKEPLKCNLFGNNILIKPSFYLICVSSSVIPYNEEGFSILKFMTINNFNQVINVKNFVHSTLLLSQNSNTKTEVSGTVSAPKDKIKDKDKVNIEDDDETALENYNKTLQETTSLLCEDIDEITGNKSNILERLDILLSDLNTYHARVSRFSMHQQVIQRRLQDSWKYLKQGIFSIENALQLIEMNVLGRCWKSSKLEALIVSAKDLLRPYQKRISPNTFEGLIDSHKEFYATVNFLERVVQVMSCGWPSELRGIFAFFILSSVVNECEVILRLRGELYSSSTVVLNREQYNMLKYLLDRKGKYFDEDFIRNLYANSSDLLLNDVAKISYNYGSISAYDDISNITDSPEWIEGALGGGGDGLIRSFFLHWMQMNYVTCELIASHLYDVFLFALKEQNNEGEDEVAMLYDYVNQSPVEVNSSEEWLRFSLNFSIPQYLETTNSHHTIKYLERRASAENFVYHFFQISNINDLNQVMKNISIYYRTRPVNQGRGHFITILLVPPENPIDEANFIQSLSVKLSLFCHYGTWGLLRTGNPTRFPVLLFCIVQKSTNSTNNACVKLLEEYCFTVSQDTSISRFYLFHILQNNKIYPPWKKEGTTLLIETKAHKEKSSESSKRHSNRLPLTVKMANVIELHVGLISGQSILRSLWENEGFTGSLLKLYQKTLETDDLAIILRLMANWVRSDRDSERAALRRRRSMRLLSRSGPKVSILEGENIVGGIRPDRDVVSGIFSKVAYAIYTARMLSKRSRFSVAEVLRQRIVSQGYNGGRITSTNITIDDATKLLTSDAAFLTELKQSSDDFLGLCGDDASVDAYREIQDIMIRNLLYGNSAPPESIIFLDQTEKIENKIDDSSTIISTTPSINTSNTALVNTNIFLSTMSDIIQLLFYWEKNYAETLIVDLINSGQTLMSSKVQTAIIKFSSWAPGETLNAWLPALKHPKLLIYTCMARAVGRKVDDFNRVQMILIIIRRYNLLHDDIILTGATVSKSLEQELLYQTGWNKTDFSWKHDIDANDSEEDIIIAIRFQKIPEADVMSPLSDVLWDARPGERRSEVLTSLNVTKPSMVFLTGMTPDIFQTAFEIQSSTPIPVICVRLGGSGKHDWYNLFDLPLYIILTGNDEVQRRRRRHHQQQRRSSTAGYSLPTSTTKTPTKEVDSMNQSLKDSSESIPPSVISGSLSFFVTIS